MTAKEGRDGQEGVAGTERARRRGKGEAVKAKSSPGNSNERVVMCLSVPPRSLIRPECLLAANSSGGHSGRANKSRTEIMLSAVPCAFVITLALLGS